MKKQVGLALLIVLTLSLATLGFAQLKAKADLKAGDERYVCNCGPTCPCNTISKKEGNCTCGKPMVKAKVVKMDGDMAVFKIGDREQAFKTTGKYACACGPTCPCETIGQNPGKCPCGTEMKPTS